MLATPEYLTSNLTQELEQLESERKLLASGSLKDDVGLRYVVTAEAKVSHQIEKASALETPGLSAVIRSAQRLMEEQRQGHEALIAKRGLSRPLPHPGDSYAETPEHLLSIQGHASGSSPPKYQPPPMQRGPKTRRNVNPAPPPSASSYFFYQAANGAPLFLHPLDSKILLSHFKTFADAPDEIEFPSTTVSYTASTINDEVRKRYKYLSHLPEGADVTFIETGWELEAIVGPEGLKPFEGALKMRQGKREQKEKKEERARQRAEERDRDAALQALSTWVPRSTRDRSQSRSPSPPPATTSTPDPTPGAWGNRSFASAIRTTSNPSQQSPSRRRDREREEDLEWESAIDAAWRDLEISQRDRGSRNAGGKKKGGKKLVILSSNGRGRS